MMKRLLVMGLMVLAPAGADAATVLGVGESELTRRADVVAFGAVISAEVLVEPKWGVYTRARVEVYDGFKGAARGDVLTVLVPGGRVSNGLHSVVAGAPMMKAGDRFVAFLEKRQGTYVPWGLSYGWLKVRQDAHGVFRVSRSAAGLSVVGPAGEVVEPGLVVLQDIALGEFKRRILGHLAAGADAPAAAPERGGVR